MQKVKADKEQQNLKRKESINSLEVIDVSGSKTSLALSTNANNVTMDTGYNVQEYADARMKESARTFTSDGSPIEVNNGSDKSKILQAEICGRTEKRLSYNSSWVDATRVFVGYNNQELQTVDMYVTNHTDKAVKIYLTNRNDSTNVEIQLDAGKKYLLNDRALTQVRGYISDGWTTDTISKQYLIDNVVVSTYTNNPIPFGLSSTQAIISNGSNKYPFHSLWIEGTAEGLVPTIDTTLPTLYDGDVLDRRDNTITFANGDKRVLTTEEMKSYLDYQRIISLSKVGDVADKLEVKEDGSVVWNENFAINIFATNDCITPVVSSGTIQVRISNKYELALSSNSVGHCDKIKYEIGFKETEHIYVTGNIIWIHVLKTNIGYTEGDTGDALLQKVKTYLSNVTGGSLEVIYQKYVPTTHHIPKQICPTIPVHKTNIVSAGDAVKPSSFTIVVPTTDDIRKEITQTLLNGYTNVSDAAKASLLKNGKARIELDITAPAENMSATILTLPTELRPTANRKIQVFVNGVSQLATLRTDGTLLLSVAPVASANIYIKEEYTM